MKAIVRARKIEHRPFVMPPESLCNPKLTQTKVIAEGQCRYCRRAWAIRAPTRHHLVPESWFLQQPRPLQLIRNAHANIIPLCRGCHDLIDNRVRSERLKARKMLRVVLTQAEIAFAIAVRGQEWLDAEYPRR